MLILDFVQQNGYFFLHIWSIKKKSLMIKKKNSILKIRYWYENGKQKTDWAIRAKGTIFSSEISKKLSFESLKD